MASRWTRRDLESQFRRARKQGWIAYFREAATKSNFETALLMGVASRETEMGGREIAPGKFQWLERLGDNGHGCGLMQVDIGTDKNFLKSGKWKDAREGILRGTEILAEKRAYHLKNVGRRNLKVRFSSGAVRTFDGKAFNTAELLQLTVSAYNCGAAAYYHFSQNRSIDSGTTGKDYSADTLARAKVFRELLAASGDEPLAAQRDAESVKEQEGEAEEVTYTETPSEEAPAETATADKKEEESGVLEDLSKLPLEKLTAKVNAARVTKAASGPLTALWATSGTSGRIWLVIASVALLAFIGTLLYLYRKELKRGIAKIGKIFKDKE